MASKFGVPRGQLISDSCEYKERVATACFIPREEEAGPKPPAFCICFAHCVCDGRFASPSKSLEDEPPRRALITIFYPEVNVSEEVYAGVLQTSGLVLSCASVEASTLCARKARNRIV